MFTCVCVLPTPGELVFACYQQASGFDVMTSVSRGSED